MSRNLVLIVNVTVLWIVLCLPGIIFMGVWTPDSDSSSELESSRSVKENKNVNPSSEPAERNSEESVASSKSTSPKHADHSNYIQ